jgi:hypothetical protein
VMPKQAPIDEVLSVLEDERVTEAEFHAGTAVLTMLGEGHDVREKLAEIDKRADALDEVIAGLEARRVG